MTVTARQRACLDAMGIDVWHRRQGGADVAQPGVAAAASRHSLRCVLASSPAFSGLVLISDCPASGADPAGFDGEAGALLDAMLNAIGLSRAEIEIFVPAQVGEEGVSLDQLANSQRRCALVMRVPGTPDNVGDVASSARLPLINSLHPVHLLSHPDDKRRAWEDLKRARERLST